MVAEAPGPCPPPGLSPHPRKSQVQAGGEGRVQGKRKSSRKAAGQPRVCVRACVRACVRHGVDTGTGRQATSTGKVAPC